MASSCRDANARAWRHPKTATGPSGTASVAFGYGAVAPSAFALALALLALTPNASRAWLPEGHMATGALAFDALERRDPQAAAVIVRLMEAHPERARFDQTLGDLEGPARDRRLFELMARWPDDARRGPFDHDNWHYSQTVTSSMRFALPFAFGGAERAFPRELAVARDPHARPGDRAVALCWVMHIVGDMHQPLHAALWMSGQFPITDRGGNSAWVRTAKDARPERLHWFWDSAAGQAGLGRGSPMALETQLEAEHPDSELRPSDPRRAFEGWVVESRRLARDEVYDWGALRIGTEPATAPVLSPAYIARARISTGERLALAGFRIGALLVGLR